jgi:hypothetical protein
VLLRVDDPTLVPDLMGFLRQAVDVVAAQVGDDEVLVGLLGSRCEASQREELEARLAGWRERHPGSRVLLADRAA